MLAELNKCKNPAGWFLLGLLVLIAACDSSDDVRFGIESVSPVANTGDVARDTTVAVIFTSDPDPDSITPDSLIMTANGARVVGTLSLVGRTLIFRPNQPFADQAVCFCVVQAGIGDRQGESLGQEYSWHFRIGDFTAPRIQTVSPVAGIRNVSPSSDIFVVMTEEIDPASLDEASFRVWAGESELAGIRSIESYRRNEIHFDSAQPLPHSAFLTVVVTTGIRDMAGNSLAADFSWQFQIAGNIATYGGENYDEGRRVLPTADGGFVVIGTTASSGSGGYDLILFKVDSYGRELWSRTYGGSGNETGQAGVVTVDGGFLLLGSTESEGAGGSDIWLVRTDAAGEMLWSRTYGGSGNEIGFDLILTSDGGILMTGETASTGLHLSAVWWLKTDAAGNPIREGIYDQQGNDGGRRIFESSTGDYFITGAGGYSDSDPNNSRAILIRLDHAAILLWTRELIDGRSCGYDFSLTPEGNLIVFSNEMRHSMDWDYSILWLHVVDQSGADLWSTHLTIGSVVEFSSPEPVTGVILDDGSIAAAGTAMAVLRLDPAGTKLWQYNFTPYYPRDMCRSLDGGFVITGVTQSQSALAVDDIFLVKFDPEGNIDPTW